MQPNYIFADELSEDVTVALRKRAEIDSRHMIVLVEHDETEWSRSLSKSVNFLFCDFAVALYRTIVIIFCLCQFSRRCA